MSSIQHTSFFFVLFVFSLLLLFCCCSPCTLFFFFLFLGGVGEVGHSIWGELGSKKFRIKFLSFQMYALFLNKTEFFCFFCFCGGVGMGRRKWPWWWCGMPSVHNYKRHLYYSTTIECIYVQMVKMKVIWHPMVWLHYQHKALCDVWWRSMTTTPRNCHLMWMQR